MNKSDFNGNYVVTENNTQEIKDTNCMYTVWKWTGSYYKIFSGSMYTEGFAVVEFDE